MNAHLIITIDPNENEPGYSWTVLRDEKFLAFGQADSEREALEKVINDLAEG